MVVSLAYSFIPLEKLWEKGGHSLIENPRKRAENTMAPKGQNLSLKLKGLSAQPVTVKRFPPLRWHQSSPSLDRNDTIRVAKDSTPIMLF